MNSRAEPWWSAGGRTNNYVKVVHLVVGRDGRYASRSAAFFFDDREAGQTREALEAASRTIVALSRLTETPRVHLSVFRALPEHPEIVQIGAGDASLPCEVN